MCAEGIFSFSVRHASPRNSSITVPLSSPQLLPTGVCLASASCPCSRYPEGLGTGLGSLGFPGGRGVRHACSRGRDSRVGRGGRSGPCGGACVVDCMGWVVCFSWYWCFPFYYSPLVHQAKASQVPRVSVEGLTFNEFYPLPLLFQKKLVTLALNSVATAGGVRKDFIEKVLLKF